MCHSQSKECREKGGKKGSENEENGIALMLDFLCGWEQFQKGNTGSHIPQMQKRMILLYLRIPPYLSSDGLANTLK